MGRGLIIPSSMIVTDEGPSSSILGRIGPEVVRHWLLFWDEFNCPDNSFIDGGLTPELEYLQDLGLLKRNRVNLSGSIGGIGSMLIAVQNHTYQILNKSEPGKWTVASSDGIIITDSAPEFEPSLIFDLTNVFQVPQKIASLDDIIEFKLHRSDELAAFHSHLDDVYARIMNSRDLIRSKSVEMKNLEKSMRDYNSALAERFPYRLARSLRIVLDRSLFETVGMGMAGAGFAPLIDLPSLDFGVYAASATFVVRNVLKANNSPSSPLTYISCIRTDL